MFYIEFSSLIREVVTSKPIDGSSDENLQLAQTFFFIEFILRTTHSNRIHTNTKPKLLIAVQIIINYKSPDRRHE